MTHDSTPFTFSRWINHVVTTLKSRDFVFIVGDASILPDLERQNEIVNAKSAKLASQIFGYIHGLPGPIRQLTAACIKAKDEKIDISGAERLFLSMRDNFSLNALGGGGSQYLACLHCDNLSIEQIQHKCTLFGDIGWSLKKVFGIFTIGVLGVSVTAPQETSIHASLCLVFTDPKAFEAMAAQVSSIKLRSMTIGENLEPMKYIFPFSLMRFVTGPPKGPVELEKIFYRTYDSHIESNKAFLRMRMTWGFSLSDLVLSQPGSP